MAALHVGEWLEDLDAPDLTPAERDYVDGVNRWREDERGYGHVQANRPHTLGLALDDSPLGLLAWIADKWLSWSDPACELDDDLILTTATIYWVTRTIAPSMRAYAAQAPPPRGKVAVPTASPSARRPARRRRASGWSATTPTCATSARSPAAATSGRPRRPARSPSASRAS